MKKLFLYITFIFSVAAFAQGKHTEIPQSLKAVEGFIPKGWDLIYTVKGDLNSDGKEDIVLVVENRDKANIIENPDKDCSYLFVDLNPRQLLVLFKNADNTYQLSAKNEKFVSPPYTPETPCYYAAILKDLDISIKNGELCFNVKPFKESEIRDFGFDTYKLKYINGVFKLVSFVSWNAKKSDGIVSSTAIDFLTKEKISATGRNLFDGHEENPVTTTEKITVNKLLTFDELGRDTELKY